MKVDRDQAEFLDNSIKEWQQKQLIDEKTALKIRESYEVKGFDWERLAKYSFWVAMTCVVVVGSPFLVRI